MSRATSGSAPSFTVSAQVVWSTQRWATPSATPLARTASRTCPVMSSSSSRSRVRTRMRSAMALPQHAFDGVERARLELHGHVADAEALVHAVVDLVQDALVLRRVAHDGVAAHGEEAAGHGPDVEIVHLVHAGDLLDGAAHLGQVDVPGHRLEQHVHGLADQLPA